MVPWQLITVVHAELVVRIAALAETADSTASGRCGNFENSLRGANNGRRHRRSSSQKSAPVPRRVQSHEGLLVSTCDFTGYRGDAVDFDQRISRQCSHRNRGAGRPAVWEISPEDLVHSLPVFNLHQEDVGLKDGIHRSAADFNHLFDFVHDHGGVGFNRPFFLVSRVVRALPGNIDQARCEQ